MTDYKSLIYEVKDAVATLTLNRPERLNALGGTLRDDLYDAVLRASGCRRPRDRGDRRRQGLLLGRRREGHERRQGRSRRAAADRQGGAAPRSGAARDARRSAARDRGGERRRGRRRHEPRARLRYSPRLDGREVHPGVRQAGPPPGLGRDVLPAADRRHGQGVRAHLHGRDHRRAGGAAARDRERRPSTRRS